MAADKLTHPNEIARETLKQLVVRRIPPTPEHYEEVYTEIAGIERPHGARLHPLVQSLLEALRAMPRKTPEILRNILLVEQAASSMEWHTLPSLIFKAVEMQGGQAELTCTWSDLIRDLIIAWERHSPNFNRERKQESLTRVLLNFGASATLLNEKLSALVRSWLEGSSERGDIEVASPAADVLMSAPPLVEASKADVGLWRELLVKSLQAGFAPHTARYPELEEEAASLIQAARAANGDEALNFLAQRLERFWPRLALRLQGGERIERGLVNLLLLLSENLVTLTGEDDWVKGQLEAVRTLLAQPLDMRVLYDAEVGFKEIVARQAALRRSLDEAQEALRGMLALFVDRLGAMADSTGGYHDKIMRYGDRIEQASDLTDLKPLIEELVQDTRNMQLDMARTRDELVTAQTKAAAAEARIAELERELKAASEKIREDQLTGALNRRGFDESFALEIARAQRNGKPLCVAMLDIDNFKKLNDRLGHGAGDDALIHLVHVIRDTLRPTDIVARYGGEEFVVLLPETVLSEAANIMRRVQRELTKRFFLHNNERILITFSAGVTRYQDGESQESVVDRADYAMYEAKRAGKNQVVVAEQLVHG
jgi:diguanylate cyclase